MTTLRKTNWLAEQIAIAQRGVSEWSDEKRVLARFEGAEHSSKSVAEGSDSSSSARPENRATDRVQEN